MNRTSGMSVAKKNTSKLGATPISSPVFTLKLPRRLKNLSGEAWLILVLMGGASIELAHLANSDWLKLFLYNGDSLTLPILQQALSHHNHFWWISSSQFLIFPEGVIYAFCSLITPSVRTALVCNALINILLFYFLVRWIAATGSLVNKIRQRWLSLTISLLLIGEMLLERHALINSSSVATLYLFNSYYYGVIVVGLALLALNLRLIFQNGSRGKRLTYSIGALALTILATFSDPIFLVEIIVPLLASLLMIWIYNGVERRKIILPLSLLVAGAAVGYLLRLPFSGFIGESLNHHLVTENIPPTLTLFHTAISHDLHTKSGLLELMLVLGATCLAMLYLLTQTYRRSRQRVSSVANFFFFLLSFAVFSSVVSILFTITTGALTTRYLLPVFILPLLGLLYFYKINLTQRTRKIVLLAGIIASLGVFSLGILSLHSANNLVSSATFPDAQCLSKALYGQKATGIADYWLARPLDVYGTGPQVLQATPDLSIYPWQANLDDYTNKQFSFVVVDKTAQGPNSITESDSKLPGQGIKVHSCSGFRIYTYEPGSVGFKELNASLGKSYAHYLQLRQEGLISQVF